MTEFFLPVLLALGSYRLTRLMVKDDFPPVLWARDRIAGGWRPLTSKEKEAPTAVSWRNQTQEIDGVLNRYMIRKSWSPHWLADLITCPWCASGWVSGSLVLLAMFTVGLPAPFFVWLAVWAVSSLLASRSWA